MIVTHLQKMLLQERVRKIRVIQGGQKVDKLTTNRKGYRIDPASGEEVKMTSKEVRELSRIQKQAARKRAIKMKKTVAKRRKSMKKHTWKGTWSLTQVKDVES